MTDQNQAPANAQERPRINPLKASTADLEKHIAELKAATGRQPTEVVDTPPEEEVESKTETKVTASDELEIANKRLKDLQSYSDKRYNTLTEKLDQVLQQNADYEKALQEVTKVKHQSPLSDEDFDTLTKDFPNVDAIAHARALKLYEELSKPLTEKIDALTAELGKSKELTAKEQLRKLHPDFEALEHDPDFIQWFGEQPTGTQNLIRSSNIKDIAAGLDYYKLSRGIKSTKEKKLEASAAVDTKSATTASTSPPRQVPLSEVRAKMAELSKRGGKKLEEYVDWYMKAKAEGKINFNN